MLVVKLELWATGDPADVQSLGEIRLINDGTGTPQTGNYDVELAHSGRYAGRPGVWKRGRVEGFDRVGPSPYHLLLEALKSALENSGRARKGSSSPKASMAGARPSTDTKPCNGCGQPIRWARTAQNKAMPVEAEPLLVVPLSPDATSPGLKVILLGDGRVISAQRAQLDEPGAVEAYESHFARCTQADRFRRERGSNQAPETERA